MKNIKHFFAIFLLAFYLLPHSFYAESNENAFDFILALTQQDIELNWWFCVPAQFHPNISQVKEVTKGEYFKILPIFNNYGVTESKEVDITYDIEILRPDGTIDESEKNVKGFKGHQPTPYLLPSVGILLVSFDPEDSLGEYTVKVTAYDHIKKQNAHKSQNITLKNFNEIVTENNSNDYFLTYPTNPKPSLSLSKFINPIRPYLDDKGRPLWSALWFYKIIYSENEFLIPHTVEFYKSKATKQQQKEIITLFYFLNKTEMLPIENEFKEYQAILHKIIIPKPYESIESGDQLDMLWAEFFATSKIKPIRQILTSLNLSNKVGTLEKIKTGKLSKSDQILKNAMLEAVFQSAMWSIMSNCKQSLLLFQYLVGIYESDQLNDTEKGFLGVILKKVSEEKQNTIK